MDPTNVVGKNFFVQVAPCTNNAMVAERYRTDDALDETINYVFTYRMVPTPVTLRLAKRAGADTQYLLVKPATDDR
jgi:photoactive yellow protein